MDKIFSRTGLLLGEEAMEQLKDSHVAIFGIGGVGGYVCEALARSGIYKLDLFDNDTVSETNINRQIIATSKTVGKYKTELMKERILEINPMAEVKAYNMFFTPENSSMVDFGLYDYVVDAIDTVTSKIELIVKCNEKNVKIISSMGAGNKMNPAMLEVSDIYKTSVCPLARVMRRELKLRNIKKLKVVYSKEVPIKPLISSVEDIPEGKHIIPGSNAFVPSVAGLIAASEVIKDIIKKSK